MLNSLVFGVAAAIIFGVADVLLKVAVGGKDSRAFLLLTLAGSLPLCILAVLMFDARLPPELFSPAILFSAVAASLCASLGWDAFFRGLESGRVSVLAPLTGLCAVVAVLACVLFLGEPFDLQIASAFVLAVFGAFLCSLDSFSQIRKLISPAPELGYGLRAILGFGFAVFFSLIVVRSVGPYWDMLIARILIPLFLLAAYRKSLSGFSRKFSRHGFSLLVAVTLLYWLAAMLYDFALLRGVASLAAPIVSSSPAITAVIGVYFLREKIAPVQKLGIVLVLAAIVAASV